MQDRVVQRPSDISDLHNLSTNVKNLLKYVGKTIEARKAMYTEILSP